MATGPRLRAWAHGRTSEPSPNARRVHRVQEFLRGALRMIILNEEVAVGAYPSPDGKGGRERGHRGLRRRRAWRGSGPAYGRIGRRRHEVTTAGWTVNEIPSTPGVPSSRWIRLLRSRFAYSPLQGDDGNWAKMGYFFVSLDSAHYCGGVASDDAHGSHPGIRPTVASSAPLGAAASRGSELVGLRPRENERCAPFLLHPYRYAVVSVDFTLLCLRLYFVLLFGSHDSLELGKPFQVPKSAPRLLAIFQAGCASLPSKPTCRSCRCSRPRQVRQPCGIR